MAVIRTQRNRMVAGPARTQRVQSTPAPAPASAARFRMAEEAFNARSGLGGGVSSGAGAGAGAGTDYSSLIGSAVESALAGSGSALGITIGGGGGGGGRSAAAGRERQYIQRRLKSGEWRRGLDDLLKAIETEKNLQRTNVQAAYNTALDRLLGAAAPGTGVRTGGTFGEFQRYIEENPLTAYAQAREATAPDVQNALAQYMVARGVPTTRTEAEATLANITGAAGAEEYNRLLNLLRAAETTTQASRLTGAAGARTAAQAQFDAALAARLAGIEQERAAARTSAEQAAYQRRQELLDRLQGLSGY